MCECDCLLSFIFTVTVIQKKLSNWQSAMVCVSRKEKKIGVKPKGWTSDLQKRRGERHGEQSGWYHASGPTVLAGKAQGREGKAKRLCRAVQAVQAVQDGARRRAVLCCVFLLVTTARLLKISGVVNALLCFIVAEWRRPEEDKGDRAPRKRMAERV